jgi:hypothetical protein
MGYTVYDDGGGSGGALVQHAVATGTGTAPACTFAGATTAGNTVLAKVTWLPLGGSLTMPAGFGQDVALLPGAGPQVSIWSYPGAPPTTTVTGALSGSAARWILAVEEWSGILSSSPLDQTADATSSGASGTSGTTSATTQADEVAAAAIAADDGTFGDGEFSSPTNGYTLLENKTNGNPLALATLYKVLSATGAQSTSVDCSTSPGYYGVIATYKSAGAHTVSSSGGPVQVSAGTSVSFATGVTLTGDDSNAFPPGSGLHGLLGDTGSLSGGDVTFGGGADAAGFSAGSGVVSYGQSFAFTGTLTCAGAQGLYYGADGATVVNPTAWSVAALACTGGDGVDPSLGAGGAGLSLCLDGTVGLSSLTLPSAAVYTAGSGGSANAALAVELHGSCAVTVPGGTFAGYLALYLADTASVTVQGSGLSWSGGSLTTGLSGTLSGTIGGASVSLTVLCTGPTLSASGSGSSVTFAP